MKKALFLLLLVPFLAKTPAQAQDQPQAAPQSQDPKGIHFEHNLSWAAIQAKAKAGNKYIFMDCFTT
jgi:hypothetical protein